MPNARSTNAKAMVPKGVENAMWNYLDTKNAAKLAMVNKELRNTTRRVSEEQSNIGKAIRNARNTTMNARLRGAPEFVSNIYRHFKKHHVVVELSTSFFDIDQTKQSLKYRITNTPGMSCTLTATRAPGRTPIKFVLPFDKLEYHFNKWVDGKFDKIVNVYIDSNTEHAFVLSADAAFEDYKFRLGSEEFTEQLSHIAQFTGEYTNYLMGLNAANANMRNRFPQPDDLKTVLDSLKGFMSAV